MSVAFVTENRAAAGFGLSLLDGAGQGETFLRAIFETTPECIKIVSAGGQLLQMNAAGLTMIEADDLSQVDGAPVLPVIAPEHRGHWWAQHQRVCGGERLTWEFDVIGLHGARRHMETHAAPIQLPSGETAQLAITRDVTVRKAQEQALRESERQHRELLQALPAAIYTTDPDGKITFYNKAAAEFTGNQPSLGSDSWCVSWKLFWPDGSSLPHDQCPMAVAIKEQRPILGGCEALAERPDGTRRPFMPFATPLFDDGGQIVGAVNMLVDMTERHKAEEQQRLMIDELNHRVKNALATVQSIAVQTCKDAASLDDFRSGFEARLVALGKAHDLLSRTQWSGVSLEELLGQALAAFAPARIRIEGPDVRLAPGPALSLGLVTHELTINAVTHGALSAPDGRVEVLWTCTEDNLRLTWTERGGPAPTAPAKPGFGLRLLERSVERDLNGKAVVEFGPAGMACVIDIPLDGRAVSRP